MPSEYVVLIRDPRTLALQGEVSRYQALHWVRRDLELGEFELSVATRDLPSVDLIARNMLIEIRRDGQAEFAGLIRGQRKYDAIAQTWTVGGPDLRWFLSKRLIVPVNGQEFDSVSLVPAETAMLHYVTAHLGSPTDSRRALVSALSGLSFVVQTDSGRGAQVSFNGRFANLLTGCLVPLARSGDLLHELSLLPSYAGYQYAISLPVDATATTGAVPVIFSTGWGDVGQLTYDEDYSGVNNAVYVLGQGQGAARACVLVWEDQSVASDFWCESSLDSRNNADVAAMVLDGETAIQQALDAAIRLDAEPLIVGPNLYRSQWDVGSDVTLQIPEVGISVDKRIVEVKVQLDAHQGEIVTIALGSTQRTAARVMSAALAKSNRVVVA